MTASPSPRPPLPPFDRDAAIQKVRLAEDACNTRDPQESRPATPRTACGAIARSFSARDQGLPAVYARRAPLDAGGYGGVFQPRAGRAADAAGEGGPGRLHAPAVACDDLSSSPFVEAFSDALRRFTQTGAFRAIYRKYFPTPRESTTP